MKAAPLLILWLTLAPAQSAPEDCYPITAADLQKPGAPTFEQFSARVAPAARPPLVDLNSHPLARRYRTVLLKGVRRGPNFAGHYTVIAWGCGTSCIQFAIVDALTGKVFFPNEFQSVSGVQVNDAGFEPEANRDRHWGLRYRPDSRLLVVLGALDERADREGATYYSFDNGAFRRLHTLYVKKHRCDVREPVRRPTPTELL